MVKPKDCPKNAENLPKCNVVKVGGLCEADGECKNTNKEANNCGESDVYKKVAASLLETEEEWGAASCGRLELVKPKDCPRNAENLPK